MSSENTETNPGNDEETAGQSSLSVELSEQALGAEVDCPGAEDLQRKAASGLVASSSPGISRVGPRRSKRPEDRNCSTCKTEFSKQGRCFNRRAVYTFTTPDTVQWAFPGTTVNEKSFLCENCAQFIRSKCTRKPSGKRIMWLKPTLTKKSRLRKKQKGPRMGKKSKAALLVSKSCYKSAFKMLWSAKGARKPMLSFLSRQLKEEMKILTRQTDSPFHLKVSNKKPLSSFPWRRCLNWAQDKAPLVTTCLVSLFPDIKALSKSSHQMTDEQAQILLERRAVLALSIPLFTRNSWKNNYLQASLGAELRQEGCSSYALDYLNSMGLCQNKYTVALLLNKLRSDDEILAPNREGMMMIMTPEQIKVEQMADIEEEFEDDDDEEEMGEDDDLEYDGYEYEDDGVGEEIGEEIGEDIGEEIGEDLGEVEEEEEMEMVAAEEEVEEVEVLEGVQQEDEGEDQEVEENIEIENKKRKKKAKKQKKGEKRKARGKRKAKEDEEEEEEEEDEEDEEDEGSERKKKRVVVVRLGLLKGHSEVGRSDLSAP